MTRTEQAWARASLDLPFRQVVDLLMVSSLDGALDAESAEGCAQAAEGLRAIAEIHTVPACRLAFAKLADLLEAIS